jgi:hypothetical protein
MERQVTAPSMLQVNDTLSDLASEKINDALIDSISRSAATKNLAVD